jgi:DNA-binding CsgD family transcriptional regulator
MLYPETRLLLAVISSDTPESVRFVGMLLYVLAPAGAMSLMLALTHIRTLRQDRLAREYFLGSIAAFGVLVAYAVRFGVSSYHPSSLILVNNIAVHSFYLSLFVFLLLYTRIMSEVALRTEKRPSRFRRYFGLLQFFGIYMYAVGLLAFWRSGVNVYVRLVELGIACVILSGLAIAIKEGGSSKTAEPPHYRIVIHASRTTMAFFAVSAAMIVLRETAVLPDWADPVLIFPVYVITLSIVLIRPALSVSTRSRGENSDQYQEDISHEAFVRGLVTEYAITPQEERVLQLVMLGKSNSEIANLLGIAEKTARNHVSSLYQKTETRNRVELVQVFELVQVGRTVR